MKKTVLTLAICAIAGYSFAQNEDDALRYSQVYFGGSARNMSMGGALSALGGDFSNVLTNPAGLARFKRSNFAATVNVENLRTIGEFNGSRNEETGLAANWSSLSYLKAYTLDPNKHSNWYGVTMGMGYNRIRSFNERIEYTGVSDGSIVQSFINQANGTPDSLLYNSFPFGAGLAWDTYAIDPDPFEPNLYVSEMTTAPVIVTRTVTRKGGMGEYNFSLAGNYANKLFLGGSINATRVKYYERFSHSETLTTADTSWLNGINYTGELDVNGWGWNARAGLTFLPVDWIRIGLAAQTPTYFRMNDFWTNDNDSDTDDGLIQEDPAWVPTGSFRYKVKTPFRANASLGIVLKKLGAIAAEVEYVDYSGSSLDSRKFDVAKYNFVAENSQIENLYRSVFNYKIGVEGRVTQQFYLRGGYAYFPSPYKEGKGNVQYPKSFYTGGLGYNFGQFYLDGAFVLHQSTEDYFSYDPSLEGSRATIDFRNSQYMLTIGMRIK